MNQTQVEDGIKFFLASSSELEFERVHISDLFNDINSLLVDTYVRVRLLNRSCLIACLKENEN